MKKEDREAIEEFERNARIVDRVNYIMLKEILSTLREILKIVKKRRDDL